jgi:peptide/nickel transport system substrate-binding protein
MSAGEPQNQRETVMPYRTSVTALMLATALGIMDPAKAKQLLSDAGFPNGLDIDLYAYRDRPQTEAMIGYLRAVGIRANLRFVQQPALLDAIRAGKVAMMHWTTTSSIQDVSEMMSRWFGGSPDDMNRDNEVRELIDRGNSSFDPQVRKQAYAKALALIQERAYVLPLYSLPTYYVAAKDLVFTPYPDESIRFYEMSWK